LKPFYFYEENQENGKWDKKKWGNFHKYELLSQLFNFENGHADDYCDEDEEDDKPKIKNRLDCILIIFEK